MTNLSKLSIYIVIMSIISICVEISTAHAVFLLGMAVLLSVLTTQYSAISSSHLNRLTELEAQILMIQEDRKDLVESVEKDMKEIKERFEIYRMGRK